MRRRSCKRKISSVESTAVDRMSGCPDSVLVHILSFLDIKDAVSTQVLSKRWQFLSTFLPSLVFQYWVEDEDEFLRVSRNGDFVAFVEKTLFSTDCKLKKFQVDFNYEPRFASNVDSWTRFAAGKGVKELYLELRTHLDERFELPQFLYDNSWFEELGFDCCRVIPKGNVAWSSLKKLSMGYVTLGNDLIERILAGSPVLEILKLDHCFGFSRLAVTNSSVKKLSLCNIFPLDDSRLEISAPYVLSLEISGYFAWICRFMNVSSLVEAIFNCVFDLDEQESIEHAVGGLVASLVHVKNLTLGTWAIQMLSIMEAKGLHTPLLNCICLTLDTEIDKYVLPGIANVLKSAPNVDALIMTRSFSALGNLRTEFAEFYNYNEEQYWTSQKGTYKCLMLHLRYVRFTSYVFSCDSMFFLFVQFLLRNARVLQKMVISSKPSDDLLKKYFEAAQKLLSFPRCSPDAAVIFC